MTLKKFAVPLAGVFLLGFGAVVYFVYQLYSNNSAPPIAVTAPDNAGITSRDYAAVQRELEELRKRQDDMPSPHAQTGYTELVERVMPSMVFIETDKGSGSGFFVSPNGDILTNHHVIENAGYIVITTQNGQVLSALVKDYDPNRDMALLKVDLRSPAQFLTISKTLPQQGDSVIAVGNPQGLRGSVSNGIVSAIRMPLVQFTAPISPGSSGGALLNLNGEVIGMTTLIVTAEAAQNLNFAVACAVLDQFLRTAINKPAVALNRPAPQPQHRQNPSTSENTDSPPGTKFLRRDDEYAPAGKDLGICILFYNVNFRDNKYVHLRTVNYCTDGETVARDYVKPSNEIVWRTPKRGSRSEILMKAVKNELRIR